MEKVYPRNETDRFPSALVNVTNRCTLKCRHCFVFRDTSPNSKAAELDAPSFLAKLLEKKRQHGFNSMLWMGGEPLLRADVLIQGVRRFASNNITTNGTLELIDLPNTMYVVSVDGPPVVSDAVRGKGSFDRVMKTLAGVPENFGPKIMVQCVVTRKTQDALEPLVEYIRPLPVEGLTFTFYVPRKNDDSEFAWTDLKSRDKAVREIMRIKDRHRDVIRNHGRSLELMLSENAPEVTRNCFLLRNVLPLYLDNNELVTPFCCYGNDVDCDMCGSWAVFHSAAHLGL